MGITEKQRLDLRQEFERVFSNPHFAEIAMEATPPIDYDRLATKDDLAALSQELRGEMTGLRGQIAEFRGEVAGLRGEVAELRGDIKSDLANMTRLLFAAQLTTMVMLGAWVTAVV
ncbi:MAG: hypothetical protein R2733_20110 [Acidimicrobiales bacterium]